MKRNAQLIACLAVLAVCAIAYGFAVGIVGKFNSSGDMNYTTAAGVAVQNILNGAVGTCGVQTVRLPVSSMTAGSNTIDAADSGKTFIAGSAANFTAALPAATPGMNYAFANIAAATTYVDPNGTDQILYATNGAGDRIRTETAKAGCTFRVVCLSANTWVVIGSIGTITDAN